MKHDFITARIADLGEVREEKRSRQDYDEWLKGVAIVHERAARALEDLVRIDPSIKEDLMRFRETPYSDVAKTVDRLERVIDHLNEHPESSSKSTGRKARVKPPSRGSRNCELIKEVRKLHSQNRSQLDICHALDAQGRRSPSQANWKRPNGTAMKWVEAYRSKEKRNAVRVWLSKHTS
jgi:hypothetical protein